MLARPTPRGVAVAVAAIPVAVLPAVLGDRWVVAWIVFVGFAALAFGLDLLLSVPSRRLDVETRVPPTLYVGDAGALEVDLRSRAPTGATVEVVADLDPDLAPQPPRRVHVPAGGAARVEIPLVTLRRGRPAVQALHLRWAGPLGLLARRATIPQDLHVAVLPDVRPVRREALRLFAMREVRVGIRPERFVGDGTEFESLREHVPGLDTRTIDWKATARHRKVLCREHRAERDRQVVLAIDTGHRMREPLGRLPRLDHAIHAGLLLGYVALRTGDRVGLHAFDERPRAWLAPVGGVEGFAAIQSACAGLDYALGETNYTWGLLDLLTRLKRRSLVVVMTDFADVVTAELLLDNVHRLVRRHVVLFVALRDPEVAAVASAPPRSLDALYRAVTAADFEREREVVLRRLTRMGAHVLDAAPEELSTSLVNRYLDIHRRELVG
jgi:uncharacterized protein (DUF58 family)